MDGQFEEELGYEAQSLNHETQREQMLSELQEENRQFLAENKKLREAIEAAIRIKDLWTLPINESVFADEAKALQIMLTRFEQALKA